MANPDLTARQAPADFLNSVHDLLWEKLHAVAGATGRGQNTGFPELFLDVCELLGPGASFEVGAREALFSSEIKRRRPEISCYAFEANPYVFERFRKGLQPDIKYLNEAIGPDNIPKQFHIPLTIPRPSGDLQLSNTNPTSSLKLRTGSGILYETVTCKCDTLDAWHERVGWPASALWIDAEGATDEVIRGASQALLRSVVCIAIELERSAGWRGQWLAGDVIAELRKVGFHPVARDCEMPWQYNQMFVSERVMTPRILERVRTYVDKLLKTPFPEERDHANEEPHTLTAQYVPETPQPVGPVERHPDRRAQTMWLVSQGLLDDAEAEEVLRTYRLPRDFENRILGRGWVAEPVSTVPGITSTTVIATPRADPGALPSLTFDGPYPPLLSASTARYLPVDLHVANVGRIYVGLRQTTLMLDERSYFSGISRPASNWITPAFAKAPGELKLSGTVAILFANGATHFSHWMFDLLPKLEVLRQAGWTPDNIDYYVVNGFGSSFQKESFRRLGINENRVVPAAGVSITADTFLVPSDVRFNFRTPPWICEFVRDLFLTEQEQFADPNPALRLYISRGKARRRKIMNEDEIRDLVESRGFRTVFAESTEIAEIARLASGASCIFAPHGAGATNVVFGPRGIRLLESYSAHIAPEGWLLANAVGGHQYLIAGRDSEGRPPWDPDAYCGFSERDRNYADYSIRPQDLERALDIVLK